MGEKHWNWRGGKPKCKYCGKMLENRNASSCALHKGLLSKELGVGKWMKGKKLSSEWIKNRTKSQSGKNHYNWKGVWTPTLKTKSLEIISGRKKPDVCELCGAFGRRICFDHDHNTGKFRGWICHQCNAVLGLSRDNIELLMKMVAYLQESKHGNN